MKAISIFLLLIVSIALLGCIGENTPPQSADPKNIQALDDGQNGALAFENEQEAFDALAEELEGLEEMSLSDLENALNE